MGWRVGEFIRKEVLRTTEKERMGKGGGKDASRADLSAHSKNFAAERRKERRHCERVRVGCMENTRKGHGSLTDDNQSIRLDV
jgi:hypothetical protein